MKTRLPLSLLAALLAAFPSAIAAPAGTDLGNVMYVGDSITHGMNSGTYRWALHKIFADNGISYHAEGVNSGGVTAGTSYGGQVFNNEHSSQASARAWEISGRKTGQSKRSSLPGPDLHGNGHAGYLFRDDRHQRPSLRRRQFHPGQPS